MPDITKETFARLNEELSKKLDEMESEDEWADFEIRIVQECPCHEPHKKEEEDAVWNWCLSIQHHKTLGVLFEFTDPELEDNTYYVIYAVHRSPRSVQHYDLPHHYRW